MSEGERGVQEEVRHNLRALAGEKIKTNRK